MIRAQIGDENRLKQMLMDFRCQATPAKQPPAQLKSQLIGRP